LGKEQFSNIFLRCSEIGGESAKGESIIAFGVDRRPWPKQFT